MNRRYENTKKESSQFQSTQSRKAAFKKTLGTLNKVQIDQVICTGIGPFSAFHEQDAARNPYHQLADLEMFIELLMPLRQNLQNKKMNVFMQDPSFNELDEAFLRSRGFHILKHPEAYNRMTLATFLYAPGNHDDVVYHAVRVAEPALFIANDVAAFGECNGFPNRNN